MRCIRLAALLAIAALPAAAQTLTIGLATPPTALDPHYHAHAQSSATAAHVFETLHAPNAAMQLEPELATAAETTDGITWTVRLREGVRWHDGTPFTADDVAFSLHRAGNVPNSPGSFGTYTREVRQVEIIGPHELRITTAAPAPLLMANLSNIFIVSRRHGEGASTDDYNSGRAMVGTGPYRFARWSAGTEAHYTRNDTYWRGREPWERVAFRVIPNNSARTAALLAGDVDVIADIPSADVARVRGDRRLQVFTIASNRLVFLGFDRTDEALATGHIRANDGAPALTRNPLGDVRVRRALSLAIDRRALVDRINEGQAIATGQFLPEGFFGHFADIPVERTDPDAARRLLAEAGYPNGFRLTITTSNDRIVNSARMIQAVAQMWTRIGVATAVETMPHAVFTPRRNRYELPVFLSSWGNQTGEALYTLVPQLGTRGQGGLGNANRIRYSNPALDRLLVAAGAEVAAPRRLALIREATDLALAEAVMLPLLLQVNNWGARQGITMTPRIDQYTLAMSIRPAD
ncbi:ABC transporter substrate-binding protein [Roseomonas fluvialis]|uniref:ABC transporter substrate-binding protein n=1 Tax=Roseomonas fluvialis TaxID=1750527 RepID=A0ABN6P3E0_9PROT|nr:ABC transporter substrate-binding protein [Roseomonas fluvialis]BDG72921.1 ABC transporter substrate-binding protein [Roseomonas fluvialis]